MSRFDLCATADQISLHLPQIDRTSLEPWGRLAFKHGTIRVGENVVNVSLPHPDRVLTAPRLSGERRPGLFIALHRYAQQHLHQRLQLRTGMKQSIVGKFKSDNLRTMILDRQDRQDMPVPPCLDIVPW